LERWRLIRGLGLHVNGFPVGKGFVRCTLDLDANGMDHAVDAFGIQFSFGNPLLENVHYRHKRLCVYTSLSSLCPYHGTIPTHSVVAAHRAVSQTFHTLSYPLGGLRKGIFVHSLPLMPLFSFRHVFSHHSVNNCPSFLQSSNLPYTIRDEA
jgi:hypothetical protein